MFVSWQNVNWDFDTVCYDFFRFFHMINRDVLIDFLVAFFNDKTVTRSFMKRWSYDVTRDIICTGRLRPIPPPLWYFKPMLTVVQFCRIYSIPIPPPWIFGTVVWESVSRKKNNLSINFKNLGSKLGNFDYIELYVLCSKF